MGFYNLLRELRRLINNKNIKYIITFILVCLILLSFTNIVNAESSGEGGTGSSGESSGGGFRGYTDVNELVQHLNLIVASRLATVLESPKTVVWYFDDVYTQSYRIVYTQSLTNYNNSLGLYNIPFAGTGSNNEFPCQVWSNSNVQFHCLQVYYDDTIGQTIEQNSNLYVFNDMFELPNTFGVFNLLYAHSYAEFTAGDYMNQEGWTKYYKVCPDYPSILYNSNSFNNDGNLSIKPGSTDVTGGYYTDFMLDIVENDTQNPVASYLFNQDSINYDSENNLFSISLQVLDTVLNVGDSYTFYITLYNNNAFYYKYELLNIEWNSSYINPEIPTDTPTPEEPTSPDYTEGINNISNNINDVNNSINNSDVDDMSSEFSALGSGLEVNDPSGLEQIFQKLYNAFCTDEVIELNFTIPFVNKNVHISSSNISNNFPQAVKSIVSVFVWGMIGLWVLKDIRTIVDKIGEGNAENVGSDVKKEVL